MLNYFKWLVYSFILGAVAACSPVRFSKDDSVTCQGLGSSACVVTPDGLEQFGPIKFKVGYGKVDILFVNDNSASMSFEQAKMAQRFANFVQNLDARQVDYRIAITTTDIQANDNLPRRINQNGALQNGRLIAFADGSKYLTPASANRISLFNSAISRPETLECENFIRNYIATYGPYSRDTENFNAQYYEACPSPDERGVYAANLTVLNNYDSFLRSDANLAVILVSDEDERSAQYAVGNPAFPLESLDQPSTFANNMLKKYAGKAWNFHSFIVRDSTCLAQQSSQILDSLGRSVVEGSYGNLYAQFNLNFKDEMGRPRGYMLDICASDYTSQLGQISTSIIDQTKEFTLKCTDPSSLNILPGTVRWTKIGATIKFTDPIAPGTEVSITYKCQPKSVL